MKKYVWKILIPTVALVLLAAATTLVIVFDDWQPYLAQFREVFASTESVREFIAGFGVWAPVTFFFLQVAQVLFAPIPAGATTLAGAFAFGVWPGLALGMAGSIVGSAIVFAAVRRWGEPLVIKIVGKELFHRYSGRLGRKGLWLFAIFLLPFLPDDAVCAIAGLSLVSFRRFLVLMSIGRLPGMTATVMLASDAATGSAVVWISLAVGVALLLTLGFIYRKRLESWIVGRMSGDGTEAGDDEKEFRKVDEVRITDSKRRIL